MKISALSLIAMLIISNAIVLFVTPVFADENQPQWPISWVLADSDPNENGVSDNFRDVNYSYYYADNNYLYFRLECFGYPNFTTEPESRYKWFIDIDDPHNMSWSGGKVYEAEFLLFIEDSPKPGGDGIGDIYLLNDINGDGFAGNDWSNYLNNPGPILNTSIAGYMIIDNYIDIYVRQENIGNPIYPYFTWATDQEDPNLDSTSENDRSDSYWNEDLSKADISIEKSDSIDPVSSGGSFSYTLNVVNHGPNAALNVNVTDVMPDEVYFVSSNLPYGFIGSTYWWNFASLSKGESRVIIIEVDVDDGYTGIISNNASAYSDTREPSPFNNEDTEQTTVIYLADLSISKSANVETAYPGQYLIYTLNVSNNGPNVASNVIVYDTLSNKVTFNNSDPIPDGNIISTYWWDIGSLNVGQSKQIIINVNINEEVTGTIINNANVTSNTYDPSTEDNNDVALVSIGSVADLSITKTANTNFVYVGDYIIYTINVTNNGPDTAENVVVYDDLPNEVSFVSSNPNFSGISDSTYWWNIGSLNVDETKQITINVIVNFVPAGIINNIAYVTSDTHDPTPDDTEDSEQITMGNSADLSLIKTADPDVVSPGGYLKYTIVVTNNGPDAAENVSVLDTLSDKVTFISSDPTPDGNSGSSYWWNYSSLGASQSKIIIINVTVNKNASGTIINIANVTSDTHDPNPGDESNEDDEQTEIEKPPSSGGGGGGAGGGGATDLSPTADPNGPYYAFVGEEIEFNGTGSYDNDEGGGSIVRYDWKFFDEDDWHFDIGATPKYTYYELEIYNVTLRVLDDEGSSSVSTTTATIYQANLPPTNLNIIGEVKGHQNISYSYNMSAFDPDGGNITYTVNWGDEGGDIISNPIPNGIIYTVNHIWTAPGQYTITVYAEDEQDAQSDEKNLNVLIDILYVKDIGYLIDYDSDGTYDKFYSNKTKKETITEKLDDGRYLINDDDDDKWEWIYDPDTDTLEIYYYGEETDLTLWYLLLILILICLITILLLLYKKKKKKEIPSETTTSTTP